VIDTHQELVLALSEAAELEHNLICQYLFTAYSLKTDKGIDGITPADVAKFTVWQDQILTAAHQEMGHLGTVWNIAAATGASAHLLRANFPQIPSGHYPPDIGFVLERFSETALARFIDFERPEVHHWDVLLTNTVPDRPSYKRVGDLYRQIRDCVEGMPDAELLVNPGAPQVDASWANSVTVMTSKTRAELLAAIDFIIVQGEGTPEAGRDSHYEMFCRLKSELDAHVKGGGMDPARDCVCNPATQRQPDSAGATIVTHEATNRAMGLFNLLYGCLLHLLRQYYAFAGEEDLQREYLRNAAYRIMHHSLGPLGRSLSLMPAYASGSGVAGPSFEIYGHEQLSTVPAIAWAIVARRIRSAEAEAKELSLAIPHCEAVFGETASTCAVVADLLEKGLAE
jgi:hypothetical protein